MARQTTSFCEQLGTPRRVARLCAFSVNIAPAVVGEVVIRKISAGAHTKTFELEVQVVRLSQHGVVELGKVQRRHEVRDRDIVDLIRVSLYGLRAKG